MPPCMSLAPRDSPDPPPDANSRDGGVCIMNTSLIGQRAPAWRGTAYHNGEEVSISSQDFLGRWHVLYWYPLDFTFVCPTEIRGFQALADDFGKEGVSLIGASTDSFHSHKAWFADRKTFPQPITHPIVGDT